MTPPAATAAGRALPRTVIPRAPRRVSGPAARPRRGADAPRPRTRTPGAAASDPFVLRALHRTRALSDSRFLDRLIRGRLWIPLVAAGLMGIVFMQVSMLKLNAGIGRAVQSSATLERQNTNLRAAVSRMESGANVDRVAHDLGMVVPADGSARYVTAAAGGLVAAATHRMTAADPEAILRSKAATALATAQTAGTATTAVATTGLAAPQTAAATTAPTGTTATAPVTPTTPVAATTTGTAGTTAAATTTAATGTPVATTPPATTQQTAGATVAPAATPQSQPQQTASAPAAATTSGGAVAPPQG